MSTADDRISALDEHINELTEQHAEGLMSTPGADDAQATTARLAAIEQRLDAVEQVLSRLAGGQQGPS